MKEMERRKESPSLIPSVANLREFNTRKDGGKRSIGKKGSAVRSYFE